MRDGGRRGVGAGVGVEVEVEVEAVVVIRADPALEVMRRGRGRKMNACLRVRCLERTCGCSDDRVFDRESFQPLFLNQVIEATALYSPQPACYD